MPTRSQARARAYPGYPGTGRRNSRLRGCTPTGLHANHGPSRHVRRYHRPPHIPDICRGPDHLGNQPHPRNTRAGRNGSQPAASPLSKQLTPTDGPGCCEAAAWKQIGQPSFNLRDLPSSPGSATWKSCQSLCKPPWKGTETPPTTAPHRHPLLPKAHRHPLLPKAHNHREATAKPPRNLQAPRIHPARAGPAREQPHTDLEGENTPHDHQEP